MEKEKKKIIDFDNKQNVSPMNMYRVVKFGGTTVREHATACLVNEASRKDTVVVVSAISNLTTCLLRRKIPLAITMFHAWCRQLLRLEPDKIKNLQACVNMMQDPGISGAELASFGEKITVEAITEYLNSRGIRAQALWADRDGVVEGSGPDEYHARLDEVNVQSIMACLSRGHVPIVTGYCGFAAQEKGGPDKTILLGRNGSDLTAAAIASAMRCYECVIYTDVPGVMTTDPKLCSSARVMSTIHPLEAEAAAFHGASVLHYATIQAMNGADLVVRSPSSLGTCISKSATRNKPITMLACTKNRRAVRIRCKPNTPGFAFTVFAATNDSNINVEMISQTSSQTSMLLVVHSEDAEKAAAAIASRIGGAQIQVSEPMAVITVIGLGMVNTPGVSRSIYEALSNINVRASAQGTTELSISICVDMEHFRQAVKALHELIVEE